MTGKGIQAIVETILVVIHELAIWMQNRPDEKRDKDHVSKS
jgi:hypothetical protein